MYVCIAHVTCTLIYFSLLIKLHNFFSTHVKLLTVRIDVPQTTRGNDLKWRVKKTVTWEPIAWGKGSYSAPFVDSILHKKNSQVERGTLHGQADMLQGPRTRQEEVMDAARPMEQPGSTTIFSGS